MEWTYTISNNEFNLNNYPPLEIGAWTETFEPVPFEIDITYTWHSTLFGTTTERQVIMSGKIYKYKQNEIGGAPQYPAVGLYLAGSVYGESRCGLNVAISNCCEVQDFTGYYLENNVRTDLQSAYYSHIFNGIYTDNASFQVNVCTLPITFSDCTTTERDEEYMIYVANSIYGTPSDLQFCKYAPLPALSGQLTKALCEHVINFSDAEIIPNGVSFTILNSWTTGEWTKYGQPPVTFINWRCLRGKIISGRMCYYPVDGIVEGSLKYQIVSDATFYGLEVSSDGNSWTPLENDILPYDFFYRPHINELGLCNYGISFSNDGIPRFKDENESNDYIDDILNEIDADNWDEISEKYPDPQVTIGEPDEDPTTMGDVYTRAFFSQQYICSASAMSEIANALFDTTPNGIWEDIKKGLEMYGDSPVDDIQGCMYFPFPLSQVFTSTQNQNYIYFGGYRFELQNNSVDKIIYPNGSINFGSWSCPLRFGGSYRDYEPYRKLTVYLPYIGWAQLDLKRYAGKTVKTVYYIDTRTGGCMACLFANDILYDYFQGQMGISMPISATDFVAYANAQINTLLGGAGAMKNNAGAIGSASGKLVESGVASAGAVALGMTPVAGLAVGAGVAKTMYGLTQNNINNFNVTKGASSSMLNAYLPQNVMFLDEVQKGTPTQNEKSLMGYPSNASGALYNFSGYLEVDAVNLVCDTATENERAEIMALLRSGVYI